MAKDFDNLTKTDVRGYFTEARDTMRYIDKLMKTDITDYTEGGELGQAINELLATVSMAYEWREQQNQKWRKRVEKSLQVYKFDTI